MHGYWILKPVYSTLWVCITIWITIFQSKMLENQLGRWTPNFVSPKRALPAQLFDCVSHAQAPSGTYETNMEILKYWNFHRMNPTYIFQWQKYTFQIRYVMKTYPSHHLSKNIPKMRIYFGSHIRYITLQFTSQFPGPAIPAEIAIPPVIRKTKKILNTLNGLEHS